MNQNLSLYRIFYTVALTGNISHAADELFYQPACGQQVHPEAGAFHEHGAVYPFFPGSSAD